MLSTSKCELEEVHATLGAKRCRLKLAWNKKNTDEDKKKKKKEEEEV
jgi:hypothetical protein